MKVKMCKALSLFLALVLAFTLIPAREIAAAEGDQTSDPVIQTESEPEQKKDEEPEQKKSDEPLKNKEDKSDDPVADPPSGDNGEGSDVVVETTAAEPEVKSDKKDGASNKTRGNSSSYDFYVFVHQPQGGTVDPEETIELVWSTTFHPAMIQIGFYWNNDTSFEVIKTLYSQDGSPLDTYQKYTLEYDEVLPASTYVIRAYYDNDKTNYAESDRFTLTTTPRSFRIQPGYYSDIYNVSIDGEIYIQWKTNFCPRMVEVGYLSGNSFVVVGTKTAADYWLSNVVSKEVSLKVSYRDLITSSNYIVRAYYGPDNTHYIDSEKFTVTKEALAFTTQPGGGIAAPDESVTVEWETNFKPEKVVIGYFSGNSFVKVATKNGYDYLGGAVPEHTSQTIPYSDVVTSSVYVARAYYDVSKNSYVDSKYFRLDHGSFSFRKQPLSGTAYLSTGFEVKWETYFVPEVIEIGYLSGASFYIVKELSADKNRKPKAKDYTWLEYDDVITSSNYYIRAYSDANKTNCVWSDSFTVSKQALTVSVSGAANSGNILPIDDYNYNCLNWDTNFNPEKVEIGYWTGNQRNIVYEFTEDQPNLSFSLNKGDLPIKWTKVVTSSNWYVRAYYDCSKNIYADSNRFTLTKVPLEFSIIPGNTIVKSGETVKLSFRTNFSMGDEINNDAYLGYVDDAGVEHCLQRITAQSTFNGYFELNSDELVSSSKYFICAWHHLNSIKSDYFTIKTDSYSGKCGVNLTWSVNNGALKITGTGKMYDYDTTLIGDAPWHWLADRITSVEVDSGVTSIGNYAFADLLKLNSVTIPGGVTTIGSYSFKGCKALKSIVIPDSVRMLGEYAFFKAGLQSVTISSGLQIIPNAAFAENDLRNVTVPHGVIEIHSNAFASNPNLWKVDFPKTLRGIGDGAFSNCRLNEIIFPEGLNTIGERAFSNNQTVWGIKFIDGITSIGAEAFADCTALSRLDFLGAAPKFGADAFKNVEAKSYYIAGMYGWNTSVMQQYGGKITWVAIQKCGDNLYWDLDSDGVLTIRGSGGMFQFLSGDKPGWYNDRNKIKSIIIMPDVTSIGSHAFDDCTNVKTIVFYGSKPKFGMTPFTNVVAEAYYILDGTWTDLPDYSDASITWIPSNGQCGDNIFWTVDANKVLHLRGSGEMDNYTSDMFVPWSKWVPEIKAVEISEGITSIGNSAFYGCTNLEYANLPSTIKTIGEKAFFRCSRLQRVELPYGLTSIGNDAFNGCLILSEISIPNTVKTIGEYAFFGCSSLTGVKIPDSVTKMGQTAFSQCSSLSWVELGSGLKTIPSSAFSMCVSLDYIEIPDNVTTIASWAFMGCSLNNLKIQKTIESIGMGAFNSCSLGRAYFYGTPEEWNAVTKDPMNSPLNNVRCVRAEGYCNAEGGYDDVKWLLFWDNELYIEGIGNMASYSNGNDTKAPWLRINAGNDITKVVISEGVTNVGKYAFLNCKNLSSVELPDTITKIEEYAFYNCSSITELIIPESVKEIEGYAFYKCSSLQSINIPANIKELSMGVFASCSALENVDIPYGVTTIKASAFGACTSFTQIVIPSSVTRIESNVFYGCTNLEKIDLGDSVEFIGASAFSNCTKLSAITIPASVSVMQTYAFRNCTSLKTIIFEGNSQPQDSYSKPFYGVTSYAYYPASNPTWTESVRQNYGGTIKWVAVGENDVIVKFSHSCSFSSDLSVNYYIPFDEVSDYDNFRLVVKKQVFNGSTYTWMETTLTEHTTSVQNGVKYLRFEYKGVAAKEMGDELNATLYMDRYGMTFNTTVDNYSVKEYAYNRLKYSDDSIFKTLLVDMLNYGAASQTYFKYNTSHLVNADLTSDQSQYASEMPELKSVEDYMPIFTGDEPTAYFYGKSVSMSNSIELKYYMKFDSGAPADSVVLHVEYRSISGTTVSKDFHASEFVYEKKYDAYSVTISDIAAKDMSCIIDAAIYDGEYSKDNDDNRISEIFSYSIETYVYNRLEKSNDEVFKDLVRAMIKYGKSAEKYFKNKK